MRGLEDKSDKPDTSQVYLGLRPFPNHPGITYGACRALHFWSGLSTSIVGFLFLVMSLIAPNIMSEEVYGELAYSIPAEMWALCWMTSGAVIIVATNKNGSWAMSSMIKLAGHAFVALLYTLVGISSLSSLYGAHIAVFSFLTFVPAHGMLGVLAFREHRARNLAGL